MLKKLFEPISIGPLALTDRIVMTAMHLNYTPGGEVTEQFINFYRARARGGVGLMIVGGADISDQASGIDFMLSIKDDRYVPGLRRFTDAMHAEGAKTAVQLYMAGAYSFCGLNDLPTLAPSEYLSHFTRRMTKAMTLEEIEQVQQQFAAAAVRAKAAGFDAVEVSASAGYLICQFLSPKTNHRDDAYGGPLENRMRFGLETVARVRTAIGPDMALIVRIAGNDFVPGSHTNKEARLFAAALEKAGADCINVTGGWHESEVPQITMDLPHAGYAYLARGIKESVLNVPVIGCNRINDPIIAEELLAEGVSDLVGIARGLLADPEFVNKAKEGKSDEIRKCIACNQRCLDHVFRLKPVGCVVNPRTGREVETEYLPTPNPKKILVAGAGPAGCEFAVTAASRGHRVLVCERENDIGGQVGLFADATHKTDFRYLLEYFHTALIKNGVDLRLGVEVTPELVALEKPDMVVVATGAAPFKPPIDAVNAPNVCQAWDVLQKKVITGKNVVIVGGGAVGLETAVFLAHKGTISPEQLYFLSLHQAESPEALRELMLNGVKNITVLEMALRVGRDVGSSTRWVILKELALRGVTLVTNAKMKEIAPNHVVYTNHTGEEFKVPADTVVLAMGSRPENSLAGALETSGVPFHVIGDGKKVGQVGSAMDDGFDLARQV